MRDHHLFLLAFASSALLMGCADDIAPADGPDAASTPDPDAGGPVGQVTTERDADGVYTTGIDATSDTEWIFVDLETGAQADESDPWDLSMQRFHLRLNGGVSGAAGVRVAPQVGADFDAVTEVAEAGWITDEEDGDDENSDPDYAFEQGDGWYEYNPESHVLTPRDIVWVLRTGDANHLKIAIADYYDDAGSSGHFILRWAPLGGEAP